MLSNYNCNRLKHRGPDWSGLYQCGDFYLAHQRLAIIDPASGDQPLFNEDQAIVVTVGYFAVFHFLASDQQFSFCYVKICKTGNYFGCKLQLKL
jgi:hypothetical protein